MRANTFAALVMISVATSAWAQSESEAGNTGAIDREAGPLRERIRPVSGHLFLKQGRFEISPSASVTVRDAFFTKYIFGGAIAYHILETAAVSLRGDYVLPVIAGSAEICTPNPANPALRTCRSPTIAELDGQAPGQMTGLLALDFQWAPLYGKLAVLAEGFLHFDLYAIGGIAGVNYRGPPASAGGAPQSLFAPGLDLGVGARVFLNRWISVRTELRDLLYSEQLTTGSSLRNQLMFELGISLFFPMGFGEV